MPNVTIYTKLQINSCKTLLQKRYNNFTVNVMSENKVNETTDPPIIKLRTRWRFSPPATGRFISGEKSIVAIE
jgi:hypothetical protein